MQKRMLLAEMRRLVASRLFVILIASFIALDLIVGLGLAITANKAIHDGTSTPNLSFLNFLGTSGMARTFVTILGIILVTKEFSNGSILRNSINAGSPTRLLAIKMIVSMISGAIFACVSLGVGIAGALVWSNKEHFTLSWNGHLAQVCTRILFAIILGGPLGVAIGWLGKREKPTIWIYLAYDFVLVTAIVALVPTVNEWLPGGAMAAIENAPLGKHLGLLAGLGLYLVWLAAIGASGNLLMKKRGLV